MSKNLICLTCGPLPKLAKIALRRTFGKYLNIAGKWLLDAVRRSRPKKGIINLVSSTQEGDNHPSCGRGHLGLVGEESSEGIPAHTGFPPAYCVQSWSPFLVRNFSFLISGLKLLSIIHQLGY